VNTGGARPARPPDGGEGGGESTGFVRVMVVDGHRVFAEALALAVDGASGMLCVAIASGGDEAVQLAHDSSPDVVVIGVPEGDEGIDTTKSLCTQHPALRVLVLTGRAPTPSAVRAAVEAGAAGLLPKSSTLGVVCDTIAALIAGCFIVDRPTVELLCSSALPEFAAGRPAGPLTRRERDILVLLVRGVDLQNAAARLGITVNTARGYVKTLYRKLGVHNQLELVALARERGLLEHTA
jgi:DNA-binding NarL/FixJ family response regulator